jgi:hypothetical protein
MKALGVVNLPPDGSELRERTRTTEWRLDAATPTRRPLPSGVAAMPITGRDVDAGVLFASA